MAVSRRGRFVRILNQSPEETAELSGLVLQQLVRGFPERTYRFPPGTRLGPRQLVTVRPAPPLRSPVSSPDAPRPSLSRLPCPPQVWGEGRCGSQGAPPSSLGREPVRFHSSPGCVTLLLNPKGEVSEGTPGGRASGMRVTAARPGPADPQRAPGPAHRGPRLEALL